MKPKASLRSFLVLAGSALLATSAAQADTLFWDGGDTGANAQGGNGTWNNTTTNWDTAATGGSDIDWDDSDFAVFGTPAGAVTLGAPITTTGLQFNVHSYTITADTTNTLTFASGNNTISTNFTSAAGNVTNINGTVGGTNANVLFAPVNPVSNPVGHIISFGGASSGGWTGATTIDKNMIVRLQDTNQALVNTSSINLRGGTLLLTNTSAQNTLDRVKDDAVINSYGGNIRTNNTLAVVAYTESLGELKLHGGNTTLIQWVNQNTGGSQLLSFSSITRTASSFATMNVGSSLGAANLIRNEAVSTATPAGEVIGAWMISGNGTSQSEYTRYDSSGNIVQVVRNGANTISAETSIPTAWASTANWYYNGSATLTANRVTNTLRTSNNAVYQLADYSLATNGLLAGGGNLTISVPTGTGYLTAAGNPGSDNAIYINSANGFISMGAPVKDNGNAVTMVLTTGTNGGRLDMNAANEHTGGTVISAPSFRNGAEGQTTGAGAVNLGNVNALGPNTTHLRMDSGTLNTNAIAATVGKFEGFASAYLTGTAGTIFTVGNGTASNVTGDFAGTIHNVRLTKVGDGTQILSGTNVADNATAQYTVNGGTLQFAKTSSLMNSNAASWTAAKIIANTGGTLAFNVGGSGEFTTGNVTTLLGNLGGLGGSVAASQGLQANSRIGFDTTNAPGTVTLANNIADSTGAGGGAIGLTKLGTGTLQLTGTNSYSGPTTVSAGTLEIGSAGSLNPSSAITIASGAHFKYNSSTALTSAITNNGGTISGTGTIGVAVALNSTDDIIAPGNSPGIQNYGTSQTWSSFTYQWEANNFTGTTAGTDFDQIAITGSLDLSGGGTGDFILDLISLTSGDVAGNVFNFADVNRSWNILTTTTGITGFEAGDWVIDHSTGPNVFTSSPTWGGTWGLSVSGGDTLVLTYTAIPEPGAALLGGLGILALLRRRRN